MAETVILFHSALGLRPAVSRFADALREAGHVVHTPDLYEGATLDTVEEGVRMRDELGIMTLIERAQSAVAELPASCVYAGFSMGTGPATLLAATRPGARGLILMHGALAPADIEVEEWPPVPVQIHYSRDDEWVDPAAVTAMSDAAHSANQPCEVFAYDDGGHLFADEHHPDFAEPSARQMKERVLEFLASL